MTPAPNPGTHRSGNVRDPASQALPVFTIGHSIRTIPTFVDLLIAARVELVVDIRTIPRSRTNPQYNIDVLPPALGARQIGYEFIAELGGLRPKSKLVAPEVNGFWTNQSFHNYADYALTDAFELGLTRLGALRRDRRCAIMCAEAVWWRCHRRIVADYLLYRGATVFHLMGAERAEPATLTVSATAAGNKLVYPVV